jgi:hypothetical protein
MLYYDGIKRPSAFKLLTLMCKKKLFRCTLINTLPGRRILSKVYVWFWLITQGEKRAGVAQSV